jgi:uncharacterized membrane protein
MWSRAELKGRAKQVLSDIYWKALLISIVIYLVGGSGNVPDYSYTKRSNVLSSQNIDTSFMKYIWELTAMIVGAIGIIAIILGLRILIGYTLEVGGRKYFVQSAQHKENKGCFRYAFNTKCYTGIIGTMLLRAIFNFLWHLLLFFPGVIKTYAYRMVPYILADNPNIGANKAIKLSNDMTDGHKFHMFILDLSFIGWYLLGALGFYLLGAFGLFVGMLLVLPYVNATYAELYLVLRQNAIDNNFCSYEDLFQESSQTQEF